MGFITLNNGIIIFFLWVLKIFQAIKFVAQEENTLFDDINEEEIINGDIVQSETCSKCKEVTVNQILGD